MILYLQVSTHEKYPQPVAKQEGWTPSLKQIISAHSSLTSYTPTILSTNGFAQTFIKSLYPPALRNFFEHEWVHCSATQNFNPSEQYEQVLAIENQYVTANPKHHAHALGLINSIGCSVCQRSQTNSRGRSCRGPLWLFQTLWIF